MATLAALKKQMAALEAKMAKATKAEMGGAIAKVRKIMADFGLSIEHLANDVVHSRRALKSASATGEKKTGTVKAPAKVKSSKPAKYQDPASGVTWSGVGRAPLWIVNAKNRDDFLIHKPAAPNADTNAAPAKKAAKKVASVKQAMAAAAEKKAARKTTPATKKSAAAEVAPAPIAPKKASAKKVAAKKASAKKTAGKASAKKTVSKGATSSSTVPAQAEGEASAG